MKIKHTTTPASVRLLLGVVIATFVFTAAAKAQPSFAGKFTLPYEVRWGQAVLPAGDYVIRMDSTASPAKISPANGSSAGVYTEYPLVEDSHMSGVYLTITNQRKPAQSSFLESASVWQSDRLRAAHEKRTRSATRRRARSTLCR